MLLRKRSGQRGRGVGRIFSKVSQKLKPLNPWIKELLNSSAGKRLKQKALESALKTGADIISDAVTGQNIADSIKRNVRKGSGQVASDLRTELINKSNELSGTSGVKAKFVKQNKNPAQKRKRRTAPKPRKKKKVIPEDERDIWD